MQIKCNDCGRLIEMDVQQRPAANDPTLTEVGIECPDCHTWYHGYFTSDELEQKRALLGRFQAKAQRSQADFARYQRKREAFAAAFYRINQKRPDMVLPV